LVLQQYLVTIEGNKSDKVIFRALVRQVLQWKCLSIVV
jgi:hypothetical protein